MEGVLYLTVTTKRKEITVMSNTIKCWYCGLRFERHNLQELKKCWKIIHDKLNWYDGVKVK